MNSKLLLILFFLANSLALFSQLDIVSFNISINNTTPLSKASITEKFIGDSIKFSEYNQILDSDILLSVKHFKGNKNQMVQVKKRIKS